MESRAALFKSKLAFILILGGSLVRGGYEHTLTFRIIVAIVLISVFVEGRSCIGTVADHVAICLCLRVYIVLEAAVLPPVDAVIIQSGESIFVFYLCCLGIEMSLAVIIGTAVENTAAV